MLTTGRFFSLLFFMLMGDLLKAQSVNPVIPADFADPTIIAAGKNYYAAATSGNSAPHFPVYRSTDMKTWQQVGYVFDKAPEWTAGNFWAPEYFRIKNTYYIYYTARRKADNISCIGVATSKYPDRGFVDHGVIVAFGKEAIDSFVFDDGGQLYLTFKAYGLDSRPIELLAYRLTTDGLKTAGEPISLLRDDERQLMEGQSVLKHGGYYYFFYSAGDCCTAECSYNVRVARSAKFAGPYEKYSNNPLLTGGGDWKCTGHGTFVAVGKTGGYYLHHAFRVKNTMVTGRQGLLAKLKWNDATGWPALAELETPNQAATTLRYDFKTTRPSLAWQWDYRNVTPVIKQSDGKLTLSGKMNGDNLSGVAIGLRPHTDQFDMTSSVLNTNTAAKGLIYGGGNAAAGINVKGDSVIFWMIRNKQQTNIAAAKTNTAPVELKFMVNTNRTCQAFYRQGQGEWIQLGTEPIDVAYLSQHGAPRPGLVVKGDEAGDFGYFEISYR